MWKREEKFEFDQSLVKRAVFVGIDYQARFCRRPTMHMEVGECYGGNDQTEKAAEDANRFVRHFDDVGIDVAWVYIDAMTEKEKALYKITPKPHHHLIPKYSESAFDRRADQAQSDIIKYMNDHNKDILFVSGVNLNVCVFQTVVSALKKGFHVILIPDLSADACGMMAHFNNQSIFGKLGTVRELQYSYYRSEMIIRMDVARQTDNISFTMNNALLHDEDSQKVVHAWVDSDVLARGLTRLSLQQKLNRVLRNAGSNDNDMNIAPRIIRRQQSILAPTPRGFGAGK